MDDPIATILHGDQPMKNLIFVVLLLSSSRAVFSEENEIPYWLSGYQELYDEIAA